jgi:anti-sigma factor RsiW
MSKHQDKETDWLAFQYVADELSGAERADFESRLEWDEAAQRSLGSMVELTLAIAATEPSAVGSGTEPVAAVTRSEPAPCLHTGQKANRKIVWLAGCLAASAVVLIAALVAMQSRWLPSQVATNQVPDDDWQRLAMIWSETRSELSVGDEWPTEAEPQMESLASAPSPADEAADEWTISETPPWVWAGVIGAEQADGDDPTADSGEI